MEHPTDQPEPYDKLLDFFKVLGHSDRLKIAGLLAQHPATVVELARVLNLRATDVVHHLVRLEELGLVGTVSAESQAYVLDQGALLQLKKEVFGSRRARRALVGERDWEQKLLTPL
jgi:DNA-binding transcriptional ArsR family regulator